MEHTNHVTNWILTRHIIWMRFTSGSLWVLFIFVGLRFFYCFYSRFVCFLLVLYSTMNDVCSHSHETIRLKRQWNSIHWSGKTVTVCNLINATMNYEDNKKNNPVDTVLAMRHQKHQYQKLSKQVNSIERSFSFSPLNPIGFLCKYSLESRKISHRQLMETAIHSHYVQYKNL